MLKQIQLFLFFFLLGIVANAQQKKVYVHGYVEDAEKRERIAKVNVSVVDQKTGTQTNTYGFFSVGLIPNQQQTLVISTVGFKTERLSITLSKDTLLTVFLFPESQQLEEVEVKDKVPPHEQVLGGFHQLSAKTIEKTPALLGETDALKTLQLLPGVQNGKEGTVGLNVRGGSPDQNLILLDGVPVYNINHLFGFLSIFNNDAIANVDFYKGGIPARYGGRLSSVIDVSMREGNKKTYNTKISLSPVASRFLFEGPIVKDKSSFLLSIRRTWLDALTTPIAAISKSDFRSVFKFYDVNFKLNYALSPKNKLYVSYYTGRDGLNNTIKFNDGTSRYNYNWGNNTFVVRWNHLYNQRIFGNLSVSYTNFDYTLQNEVKEAKTFQSRFTSGIRDWSVKYDWDIFPSANHTLKTGISATAHRFSPEIQQIKSGQSDTIYKPQNSVDAVELVAYVEDEFKIGAKFSANVGLNASFYQVGQRSFINPQPRVSLNYALSERNSLKFSNGHFAQYLHLLSNSTIGLPTDMWVSATERIPAQLSNQVSLGYYQSLFENRFNVSIEGFRRNMQNVIEYREGASFLNSSTVGWEDKVTVGKGKATGIEFLIQKNTGKWKGWLSYTLSKSERIFSDLNRGVAFPYKYDSRHNIALTLNYEWSKNKTFSCNFFYNSGIPLQISTAKFNGVSPSRLVKTVGFLGPYRPDEYYSYFNELGLLSDRNTFRAPAYHRLDVSYRSVKPMKNGNRVWTLGVYNVYSRNNPFYLYYDKNQLKQFSLFPIIPSFTYERNF